MKRRFKSVLIKEKEKAKPVKGKVLFGVIISLCVALQIFFTIEVSATGAQIATLEEEAGVLTRENRELEDKLINSTSLIKLKEKAVELGFTVSSNSYYIEKDKAFAANLP